MPAKYRGLERFEARKQVLADLKAQGFLASEKPYKLRVPRSGRTSVIVEPMLSDQWFLKMASMAKDALEVVARGEVKFVPEHWTATYQHFLENIKDWNISRQLWWGHQIPAWYDPQGKIYVGRSEEEVRCALDALVDQGWVDRRTNRDGTTVYCASAVLRARVRPDPPCDG